MTFRLTRRVEFADTDMAGIVHFANFFLFMEAAEHALLRSRGLSVFFPWDGQTLTFPRVNASCDYLRPLRFGDEVEVCVRVERVGRTSVRYAVEFALAGEAVARGGITAVLCRVREDGALEPFEFPPELRRLLTAPTSPG